MAEKKYEAHAKQVHLLIHEFRTELNNIGQASAKIVLDPRYTQIGREELQKGLIKELKDLITEKSDKIKAEVKAFCGEYEVIHPDDDKNYSQEIANALQIIEICGFKLTKELLCNAIEPLKSSYSAMKLIHGVIHAKQDNNPLGGYDNYEVVTMLDDYMGTSGDVEAYNDALNDIRDVLACPELVDGVVTGEDKTRYSVLCLAGNMMKCGKTHESISLKYPNLFKSEC